MAEGPVVGVAAANATNAARIQANMADDNRPNIFVRELGKLAPGQTPLYGATPVVHRRLGRSNTQYPATYPGYDGTLGDIFCETGAAC